MFSLSYYFFYLELLEVKNYSVWLWSPLTITVYFFGNCSGFRLSRGTNPTYIPASPPTTIGNISYVNFTIQNVTRKYENVTMTIQAEDSEDVTHKSFTLHIYGEFVFLLYDVICVCVCVCVCARVCVRVCVCSCVCVHWLTWLKVQIKIAVAVQCTCICKQYI